MNEFLKFFSKPVVVLLIVMVSYSNVNAFGAPLPEHSLSIEFDLRNHRLTGVSNIEIPANSNINLYLAGLIIKEIRINNKEFLRDTDISSLAVPAAAEAQAIFIAFEKNGLPQAGDDPNQDLVSPEGITLTDLWHPVADQDMIFHLSAVIPTDFTAISEAEEIITSAADSSAPVKHVQFQFPYPLRNLHFIAGPYIVEQRTFSGDKTLATYFFSEDQELAGEYIDRALQYLDRYEKLIGPYPYKRFSIVENRLPSGFAMPTFTLLGQAVVRLPFIKDTSLGHEILHAWFGNSVQANEEQGNWAEGLTAYLADHAFAAEQDRGSTYRKEQLIKYASYINADNAISLKEFIGVIGDKQAADQASRAVGYAKSAMFFHMLKNEVGEDVFYKSLQHFYQGMKFKEAGWSDLLASFEEKSGKELTDFFFQWMMRNDIPDLSVRDLTMREEPEGPLLSFKLQQTNEIPYHLSVPVTVVSSSGRLEKNISLTTNETLVEIPLDTPPTLLIIDENYDLARNLLPAEMPPTWSRFEGAPEKIAVLDPQADPDLFAPFVKELRNLDVRIASEDELTDKDLRNSALLFLGTNSAVSRSLFASPEHPAEGFILDMRNNPLNPGLVVALVSAADQDQLVSGLAKLPHYRKYSYLQFNNGRNLEKNIAPSDVGMRYEIDQAPMGIETDRAQSFDEIMKKLEAYRVIYVGETHTSYEDHKLQLRIIRALHEQDPKIAIGMEMFTRPTQPALDDFVAGKSDEKTFLKQSGYYKIWQFDYRLYREILNFAQHHQIPVIALNIEKNIVSSVYQDGGTLDLEEDEKKELPLDRDLDVPGYRQRLESIYNLHSSPGEQQKPFAGFFQAQALWDETMAERTAEYLLANPQTRMVIIAGRGHVMKDSGIPPRVARRMPLSQAVVVNSDGREINPSTVDFIFASTPESLSEPVRIGVMLRETDDESGVKVADLSPAGPAIKAGIRKDDLIVAIDNETVQSIEDIKIALLFKEKGGRVVLGIRRSVPIFPDRELEIEVQL